MRAGEFDDMGIVIQALLNPRPSTLNHQPSTLALSFPRGQRGMVVVRADVARAVPESTPCQPPV